MWLFAGVTAEEMALIRSGSGGSWLAAKTEEFFIHEAARAYARRSDTAL
jgi:hypothetical protein